ncbi:MAG: H-NS family nucleoid-associated regulatory protein [Burkholderiales bacterium]
MAKSTYASLQTQIAQLQKKAQKILAAEARNKNAKVARVLKLMKSLGVGVVDLEKSIGLLSAAKKTAPVKQAGEGSRKSVAAKYRDATTGETWSGRGKTPRWLAAREAEGRKREEYKIP